MAKYNFSTLKSLTNAELLEAVAAKAPEFASLASKTSNEVFTEKGFEALKSISSDAVTRFYSIAALVGLQFVDTASASNPLEEIGIVEAMRMNSGAYLQRNAVKRIKSVSPAWLGSDGTGLKNGDTVDPFKVRKPEVEQRYFSLNWNYQNWFTWQGFDLKQGWLTENGIALILSQVYNMVDIDRMELAFAKEIEVLSGAINSETYPLKDTQVIEAEWSDIPTDDEVKALVGEAQDIAETMGSSVTLDIYNAAGYPSNTKRPEDHVMLVKPGFKSKFNKALAAAYGPNYLQFPFKIHSIATFGGLCYGDAWYDGDEGAVCYTISTSKDSWGDDIPNLAVYDEDGTCVGYVDSAAAVGHVAKKYAPADVPALKGATGWYVKFIDAQQQETVKNVFTSDVVITPARLAEIAEMTSEEFAAIKDTDGRFRFMVDYNADVLAIIVQKGAIMDLVQNELTVEPIRNPRGFYENIFFNQADNGTNFDYYRNLIVIKKVAPAEQPSNQYTVNITAETVDVTADEVNVTPSEEPSEP